MRLIAAILFAAGVTAAAMPAAALDESRVSNAKYIEAARCQGFAQAGMLGAVDTSSLDAFVREQAGARDARTERTARAARRQAQRVDGDMASTAARGAQMCAAWLNPAQVARGSGAAAR